MKKHSPKTGYWTTYGVTFTVLLLLSMLLMFVANRLFGLSGELIYFLAFVPMTSLALPHIAGIVVLRRLGLSKQGRETEIIQRGETAAPDGNCSPVEIRNPPTIYLVLALLFTVFASMVVAGLIFIPHAEGRISGFFAGLFFTAIALGCWIAFFRKAGFVAEVDEKGIRGRAGWSVRTLKWAQIASCEVARVYDMFGNPLMTTFVFKGKSGYDLLTLSLDPSAGAQIDVFKAAIAQHLSAR